MDLLCFYLVVFDFLKCSLGFFVLFLIFILLLISAHIPRASPPEPPLGFSKISAGHNWSFLNTQNDRGTLTPPLGADGTVSGVHATLTSGGSRIKADRPPVIWLK